MGEQVIALDGFVATQRDAINHRSARRARQFAATIPIPIDHGRIHTRQTI